MSKRIRTVQYSADEWYDMGRRHNTLKAKAMFVWQTMLFYYGPSHRMTRRAKKLYNSHSIHVSNNLDSALCRIYPHGTGEYLPGYDNVRILQVFYSLYDDEEQQRYVDIDRGPKIKPFPRTLNPILERSCRKIVTAIGEYTEETSSMLRPKTLSNSRKLTNNFWN